jgi:hypothetical protein
MLHPEEASRQSSSRRTAQAVPPHDLAGPDGVRSCGAVRDSTITPAAMTMKATTAILPGLSVKRSSNSQTLKMMTANRSVMTRTGWDTQRPDVQSGLLQQRAGDRGDSKRVYRPAGEH